MPSSHPAPVALVSGGARRIGAAISRALHAEGARLCVHCRTSGAEAQALVRELNARRKDSAFAFPLDLKDTPAHPRLIDEVVARFGRLDCLVNNASTFYPTELRTVSESDWEDLVGVNFKAPLFLAQAAASALEASRGAIVNIVDIHAGRPLAGYAVYSAAKAGLVALTRALAMELAPEIRVNAVAPGAILWPERPAPPGEREDVIARTALRRTGEPGEVAEAVCFLALRATYTTGEIFNVDGGRSLSW